MKPTAKLLLLPLITGTLSALPEWENRVLNNEFHSEGGAIGDMNNDGVADIVSGPYWYEGPDFQKRHELYPPTPHDPKGYSEVFFMFTPDLNGDGWNDVLIFGWPGKEAWWLENPKKSGANWKRHFIMEGIDGESPAWADLTGDGKLEIVCAKSGSFGYAAPPEDPTQPWPFVAVTPPDPSVQRYIHGMGVGDIDGDGRPDLLDRRGWWKNPGKTEGFWELQPVQFNSSGGAQMIVHDFNGDGLMDILNVRDPHAYGLSWFEQSKGGDGKIAWKEHVILTDKAESSAGGLVVSQLHAVDVLDVDGDGVDDIVTGKRWWAHPPRPDGQGGDPGVNDPALIFWLKVTREGGEVKFAPHVIHEDSGVGTQLPVGDANGDGHPDFLTASKKGTVIHIQKR
jgi:hypothetical protein